MNASVAQWILRQLHLRQLPIMNGDEMERLGAEQAQVKQVLLKIIKDEQDAALPPTPLPPTDPSKEVEEKTIN